MVLRIHDVLGNGQRLDGGAMFGNVPRALWERWVTPDDLGRIPLACRAALIEDGQRRVLLEAGIGCFFDPKLRERYGVVEEDHVLLRSLRDLGLSDEDIDVVVLSHLHFDHAGGLLAPYSPARAPELLFPKARFVVGQTAFARALAPHPRDRASFIPELPPLLEDSGRLTLVADGASQVPELGERFEVTFSNGHTPGMLHTLVRGAAHGVFFCADLVPGRAWVNLPVTMGYDRYAEHLINEKAALFPRLASAQTWLFFTHDTEVSMARIQQTEQGRWLPAETKGSLGPGFDLDA